MQARSKLINSSDLEGSGCYAEILLSSYNICVYKVSFRLISCLVKIFQFQCRYQLFRHTLSYFTVFQRFVWDQILNRFFWCLCYSRLNWKALCDGAPNFFLPYIFQKKALVIFIGTTGHHSTKSASNNYMKRCFFQLPLFILLIVDRWMSQMVV